MSIASSRCRFVVGTINGKCVSYIVDQPQPPPTTSYLADRPLTSTNAKSSADSQTNRPLTTSATELEEPNEAKINAAVTLNNQQLDELMEILQRNNHVGEQQQNRQAWSEDEASLNEQYLQECQSAVHEEPTKDSCFNHHDDSGYYGAMKPSLLELKKQQWARERAEMQELLSPWGRPQSEKQTANHMQTDLADLRPNTTKGNQIPKINHEYSSPRAHHDYYDSNYPTDASYNSPASRISRSPANHDTRSVRFNGNHEEGRLKWGDRGIAVGHLWEPSTSPSRLPEPQHTNPAWLQKSLGSGVDETGDTSNVIHGRKVYLEPEKMEEWEMKRRKALEHQRAIREQLDERERIRREEREKRAILDKEEEERIRKESAIIEERYKLERKREQKRAEEEFEELQQHNAPNNRNERHRNGWNKKEVSPRAKHRQRQPTNQPRRNNIIPSHEPEILTLHHPEDNYFTREDYSRSVQLPGGEEEMILLGKEVAVLLAPELERRILMSRSGRDAATQTDITQIFVKRSKAPQPAAPPKEKPIWGANRTTKKYIKQSDKDVYRQRGCSVSSRSKLTTDSTDDSDRYPRSSPQLDRRKRAQSLGKSNTNTRYSDEDMSSSYGGRMTRKDDWQEKKAQNKVLAPLSWSVDIRESPMIPRRATNSPPVPALVAKKNSASFEERFSPNSLQSIPVPCPPSPPVPAVLRQLQEQSLPRLVSPEGDSIVSKCASPLLKTLPLEIEDEEAKLALPEIKQSLMSVPTESADLLSQLSTIRKTLQNKQLEWQTVADEA